MPKPYEWIEAERPLPAMLAAAEEYGDEADGPALARAAGVDWAEESSDIGMLWLYRLAQLAGTGTPIDPNRFRTWIRWGRPLRQRQEHDFEQGNGAEVIQEEEAPSFGDVVLSTEEHGVIGIYVGEDVNAYHLLTCTEKPDFIRLPRALFWTARRPNYPETPPTVRPVKLSAMGLRK